MSEQTTTPRTMTLLNFSGDITLTWTQEQDEQIQQLIEQKLKEGYSFFVIHPNTGLKRLFKKEAKINVHSMDDVTKREVIMKTIDDEAIADFISNNPVGLIQMSSQELNAVEKLHDATSIAKSNTIATRPIQGG